MYFCLPNRTKEKDDWEEKYMIYHISLFWDMDCKKNMIYSVCIWGHFSSKYGREKEEDMSTACMSHSLIFLAHDTAIKGLERGMHIVLLQSCSYTAHFSVCSLNCLIERLHERIPRSCFNFLSSCASSYLHPDDVCHPVDLRLPLVAAEMPEEEKAWSHQSLISTSLFSHPF